MKGLSLLISLFFITSINAQVIDQLSNDLTVLKAETTNLKVAALGHQPMPDFPIDLSKCEVLLTHNNLNSKSHELDCTELLEQRTGIPFAKKVLVQAYSHRQFNYQACEYRGSHQQYPEECYYDVYGSQNLNCSLVKIQTISKQGAVSYADAIGFWVDGQYREIPTNKLKSLGMRTFRNGTPAIVHEFATLSKCWAGSVTSSLRWKVEFKPFLVFSEGERRFRNWDAVAGNYVLKPFSSWFSRERDLVLR